MDKSYATPELAKMAMYWGFDRPCSAGVTVKAPVLYAERETLDSVPDGVIPIPTLEQIQRCLREEKKVNVYCAPILTDPHGTWAWMACINDEAVTDSVSIVRGLLRGSQSCCVYAYAVIRRILRCAGPRYSLPIRYLAV